MLLSGCATETSGFRDFYVNTTLSGVPEMEVYSGNTKVVITGDLESEARNQLRKGYAMIGVSAFRSSYHSQNKLIYFAKEIESDIVLYSSRYNGTEQIAAPILEYTPSQTQVTENRGTVTATIIGDNKIATGTGVYNGVASTTTQPYYTTRVIPVNVDRYNYSAAFFRKIKPQALGIWCVPLSVGYRQKIERNTGVYVTVLIVGSPAYQSNILEGDVILSIGGIPVSTPQEVREVETKLSGQDVEIEIWRNERFRKISTRLKGK